nr:unnamed protein product [Callosobruchus analis]
MATKIEPKHRQLHNIVLKVATKLALPKTRRDQVVVSRLGIGHTLATHRFIFQNGESPLCAACSEPLTVVHILQDCTHHQDARADNHLPDTVSEALLHNFDRVLKFIRDTNFYYNIKILKDLYIYTMRMGLHHAASFASKLPPRSILPILFLHLPVFHSLLNSIFPGQSWSSLFSPLWRIPAPYF